MQNPKKTFRELHQFRSFRVSIYTSLALFTLALFPRLLDLNRFLTADEFLWADRSRNFLAGLTNPAYRCTTVVEKWEFAQGLACTLRTGHPGVTTMWTGSFGFLLRWLWDGRPGTLYDYVVAISTNPLDPTFITPVRLGTVLITSLWVVAVYWLMRRLFGAAVALIAAIFLALDPFHIALSRVIHHDALSTTFMTLSVLTAFVYWGEPAVSDRPAVEGGRWSLVVGRYVRNRGWLILSGALAGFGFLSKSPAMYLMPFIALVGLWFLVRDIWHRQNSLKWKALLQSSLYVQFIRTILDGLLWFAASMAVVFACWPAMWVVPVEAIETVFFIGSKYATGGHAKGNYFLGHISRDPGLLFYPVTWLYRASPLVVIGVAGAAFAWLWEQRINPAIPSASTESVSEDGQSGNNESPFTIRPFARYLPLILLFILGYYLLMTIGEKKQDRYFLPVYPWLSLIAAFGLLALMRLIRSQLSSSSLPYASRFTAHVSRVSAYVSATTCLVLLILAVNGFLVATNFPYYFTYYSPLLGGIKSAARNLTIGWGEGLDLAAAYLNETTDPANTRVASWYQSTFAPFYHGPAISYSKEKGKVLAGDYAVFYINQTQRRFPDDVLFDYFEARFEPQKIITLHGLDYAWIYPSLGVDHYIQDQTYTGIASLLAWQWARGDGPLKPGRPADFELYWEYLGKKPEERFFFRLIDTQERIWAEGQSRPVATENPPVETWREGEIIFERGTLSPPHDIPPGQYMLQIGFYTEAPAVVAGELLFTIPADEALVTIDHADASSYTLPATAAYLEQSLGQSLTLVGANWPAESVSSAMDIPVDLYWRVEKPIPGAFDLHAGLMDRAGTVQQAWFGLSLAETYNPADTTWQAGDIIHTRWQLDLLPDVPPGEYRLELVLPDDPTTMLSIGTLRIGAK